MGEEKICPINPHGNGYCKEKKCALWITDITELGGVTEDNSACAFVKMVEHIFDASSALNSLDLHGIEAYIRNDGHQ